MPKKSDSTEPMDDRESRIAQLASRPAGYEPNDPYADVDLETLPGWWREAIAEFARYGLRPYRPPRFEDGELKHEVISQLETKYDVSIKFIGYGASTNNDWTVLLNGEPIGTVPRRRDPDGYTVFEMESDKFSSMIQNAVH